MNPDPVKVPGYHLVRVVGRGGMGVVYEALREADDQRVALKVVAPDADDRSLAARFERELAIAQTLRHPNVIPIIDASPARDETPAYLAMAFVDGDDLDAVLQRRGSLPAAEVADIVACLGAALDAAHAAGLIHRDVKPANVMIAHDGAVYLCDFGLTRHVSSTRMTATGMWIGSIDYASPEQIQATPVDARADVYALAALAYHALAGHVPFPRDNDLAKLWAHVNDPRPALPPDPDPRNPALTSVIQHAMAVDPTHRPQSAGDLARALQAAEEGAPPPIVTGSVATGDAAPLPTRPLPAAAPPAPALAPEPRDHHRRRLAVAAAALALVLVGVATAVLAPSLSAPPPTRTAGTPDPLPLTIDDAPTSVTEDSALVRGRTAPGAQVEVAGRPAQVTGDRFERRVPLEVGDNRILVVATRDGMGAARQELSVLREQPAPAPIEQPAPEPAPVEPEPDPAESASFERCSFTQPDGSGPAGVMLVEQRNTSCEQAREVATRQFYEGEPDPDGWECGDPQSIGVEQSRLLCTKRGPNGRQVIAIELGA